MARRTQKQNHEHILPKDQMHKRLTKTYRTKQTMDGLRGRTWHICICFSFLHHEVPVQVEIKCDHGSSPQSLWNKVGFFRQSVETLKPMLCYKTVQLLTDAWCEVVQVVRCCLHELWQLVCVLYCFVVRGCRTQRMPPVEIQNLLHKCPKKSEFHLRHQPCPRLLLAPSKSTSANT